MMDEQDLLDLGKKLAIDDFNDFLHRHADMSDHAMVLTTAAFVEGCLERLIRHRLLDSPVSNELFGGTRPLATLSAKIAMARALGLITEEHHRVLTLMRRIRNDFAHDWREGQLEHHRARIMEMTARPQLDMAYGSDLGRRFSSCILGVLGELQSVAFLLIAGGKRLDDLSATPWNQT